MRKTIGFLTTLEQAEEFYRRCEEVKAVTLEQRLKVMADMVKERRAFAQTEEQIAKRIEGKRLLRLKHKRQELS